MTPPDTDGDHAHRTAASSNAPEPSHAERCRTLVAQARSATLCTVAREPAGFPYGSLVAFAADALGRPLLLLSTLAEHTANLVEKPEASLLVTAIPEYHGEALALGRVTLLGRLARVPDPELDVVRAAYLAAQPSARRYAAFPDFGLWRMDPLALRYVGGFGRMSWVTSAEYAKAAPDPLLAAAPLILAHMNQGHSTANLDYARGLGGAPNATSAVMTSVDRYGFELAVETPAGPRVVRLGYGQRLAVETEDEVRKAMVALVKRARAALAPWG